MTPSGVTELMRQIATSLVQAIGLPEVVAGVRPEDGETQLVDAPQVVYWVSRRIPAEGDLDAYYEVRDRR